VGKETDISKISVGKFSIGIVGLKAALEEAEGRQFSSDEEIAQYLLHILKSSNYIPTKSESEYAWAFLREYKKFKGEPFIDVEPQGLEVKILGPGCPNCDKLEQVVYKVMAESNIVGSVEHVRDMAEIASYGILPTPALVINGKVKSTGRLPLERQVLQWLEEAASL